MDEIINLIRTATRVDEPLDADTPLLSAGFIDSFDVVMLLSIFETHYGVRVSPEDVDIEQFDTPRQMLAHIDTARG